MNNHDDFIDEYIEYRIFEESMKGSGGGKPPKRNTGGSGCGTWMIIIAIAVIVLSVFGSCSKITSHKSYRSSYSSGYSSSRSYSSTYKSSSSSSKSSSISSSKPYSNYKSESKKSKSVSSDPYNAKSYYDAEDLYYDHPDDFWDYEDAEDYYNEHVND